jgi:cysteine desulfurase
MLPYFTEWYGNAATGLHLQGRRAGQAVDLAREQLASLISAAPHEIVFTGGATESNNLAILGVARKAADGQRKRIVTTAIEHKAVLEPCRYLTALGYDLVILPVTPDGCVEPAVAEPRSTSALSWLAFRPPTTKSARCSPYAE